MCFLWHWNLIYNQHLVRPILQLPLYWIPQFFDLILQWLSFLLQLFQLLFSGIKFDCLSDIVFFDCTKLFLNSNNSCFWKLKTKCKAINKHSYVLDVHVHTCARAQTCTQLQSSMQLHRWLVKSPFIPRFCVNSMTCFSDSGPSSGIPEGSRELLYGII